jgi:hypothetical protein
MLINCPECGKKISSYAEKCLGCGLPSKYIEVKKVEFNCSECEEYCYDYIEDGNCREYQTKLITIK